MDFDWKEITEKPSYILKTVLIVQIYDCIILDVLYIFKNFCVNQKFYQNFKR